MWESHESIYYLIPEVVLQPPKTPPIRSQKDERVYKFMLKVQEEARQRPRATFGHVPGSLNPRPDNWLKKHSKDPKIVYGKSLRISLESGPASSQLTLLGVARCSTHQKMKPSVPLGPPTHGLNSGKNWIEENGRTAIRSKPPEVPPPPPPMVKKKNNGRTPRYLLKRIKDALQKIDDASAPSEESARKCKHPDCRKLEEDERQQLIIALKSKWAKLNRAYQAYPSTIDTDSMKFRRERMEEELAQIERDVQLLSRRVVLVSERPTSTSPTSRRKDQRHLVSRAIG
ncbi:hypothetical protein R1flu_024933 [Riccia fluitans]|uniref:Enkurin domain-containing protein n=1 Tax=Riccia fluitans TaxID=41844 RepID=A0ABD1XZD7_9MARC